MRYDFKNLDSEINNTMFLLWCFVCFLPILGANGDTDVEFVYPDIFNDPERDALIYGQFPEDFIWSTATSSYQIEGAWNVSDKGESIWDTFSHEAGNVYNDDTGDIACDSYHKYKDDVQLMVDMGLKNYRFSISWPRLLPDGTLNAPSADGLRYYNDLIDELLANDITPMVTLYHWDLPQALQDHGGWTNESIIEHFNNYADYCFQQFGDRVKSWLTFNEPWVVSLLGHGLALLAPGIAEPATTVYVVSHTIIKSHARAWHTYDDIYRSTQKGQVGITLNTDYFAPNSTDPADIEAADRVLQFNLGWFANPIFVNGDYPEVMKSAIAAKSADQGLSQSRLPAFTDEEKDFNKGTADFIGINHYTTQYAADAPGKPTFTGAPSFWNDQSVEYVLDPTWPGAASTWLRVVPWGIRGLLNWVWKQYEMPIHITENGVSTHDVYELEDTVRVNYYKSYINEVLKAIKLDNVDIRAYTAWSLLDNFEWAGGYSERFGMHYIDFNDPERKREPKESSRFYAQIIADNGFNGTPSTSIISYVLLTVAVILSSILRF